MRMRSRARSNNPSQIITPQRRRSTWCRIRAKTYSRLGREREGKGREGKGREGERDLPGGGGGGESCPGDEGRRGESN
jgi:hypothetical protein